MSASGIRRVAFLIGLYMASLLVIAAPAQAQLPTVPAVDLSCTPAALEVDVYPGASRVAVANCELSNPTQYVERVQVQVQAEGIAASGTGIYTVGALDSTNVQITVRGDNRMAEQTRNLDVIASVIEANGAPPPNVAEARFSGLIVIRQFSRLQVESVEPFLQLPPKVDHYFVYKVYNQGNAVDKFQVGVTDSNREMLEEAGFQISMSMPSVEINSMDAPQQVRVQVRTPKNQGWTDQYFTIQFVAESEFSCRHEIAGCNDETAMTTIYVRGIYLPGFEMVPSLTMVALAAAFAGRRITPAMPEDEATGTRMERDTAAPLEA